MLGLVVALLFTSLITAFAQINNQYSLTLASVSSGGGLQRGGSYQLASSINSHAATVSGGPYRIKLGILISPPNSYQLYLPWINQ
jgi:hypothetical protein